jgi:hypothetical protein
MNAAGGGGRIVYIYPNPSTLPLRYFLEWKRKRCLLGKNVE